MCRPETLVQIFVVFDVKYRRLEYLYAVGIRSVAIVVREHCGFKCSKMSRQKCMMFYVNVFIPPMLRESLLCFCTNVLHTRIATYAYRYSSHSSL